MLPSRPKFAWDLRSPPWTDGRRNQDEYARSVRQWCRFHYGLPDANYNKISTPLRGICLSAQLFGHAKDLCICLSSVQLSSDDGVDLILNKIHQRDIQYQLLLTSISTLPIWKTPRVVQLNHLETLSLTIQLKFQNTTQMEIKSSS